MTSGSSSQGQWLMDAEQQRRACIKDQEHTLSADDIAGVARRESPRRVNAYYVEIEGRRFPPKQLFGGHPGAGAFDTGVAVRALQAGIHGRETRPIIEHQADAPSSSDTREEREAG